jgi:hypothetical protein
MTTQDQPAPDTTQSADEREEQEKVELFNTRYKQLQSRIADMMASHSVAYIDMLNQALDVWEADRSQKSTGLLGQFLDLTPDTKPTELH